MFVKIFEGELLKLGHKVSLTTVRNVLDRNGIVPAPVRFGSLGWRHLMDHYKSQILACDFLTVETLFLKTVYVFFFIELKIRRVYLAGVTSHPDGFWVGQQARQFVWELQEHDDTFRHLIHDRDSKYTKAFDDVFRSEGINIIRTPVQAPNANAYAERFVRSLRCKCLDNLLIINESHLRNVLNEYLTSIHWPRIFVGNFIICRYPITAFNNISSIDFGLNSITMWQPIHKSVKDRSNIIELTQLNEIFVPYSISTSPVRLLNRTQVSFLP